MYARGVCSLVESALMRSLGRIVIYTRALYALSLLKLGLVL
jgi:hypothetical protein